MPLEGLLVFPCLSFPSALWVMHLLTYPGRAAWGCLPGSWGTAEHREPET